MMAVAGEDPWHLVGKRVGKVQVSGDHESGPALEDEVFNSIALSREPMGDLDFEMRRR
jgi:hypothetical protein